MEFTSKQDRTSTIRQQTSRIYMTTIAANEREERLLTKKLDALDLQHKSQYIKMSKTINFTERITMKKFPQFAARMSSPNGKNRGYRNSVGAMSNVKCGLRNCLSSDSRRNSASRCLPSITSMEPSNESSEDHIPNQEMTNDMLESLSGQLTHKNLEKINGKARFSITHAIKSPVPDADPIKYTEQEVGRLRKSWAGRKTPPKRKPSFLPQLDSIPSMEINVNNGKNLNKVNNNNKRLSRPMLWEQKRKTLPHIDLHSSKTLSKSIPSNQLQADAIDDCVMQISTSAPDF